ncbi:MAG: glycosyltransferase family 2 protein [Reyranellaceae bacterium]
MAGLGSRFAGTRFAQPKPLIPVHGIPMIRLVIDNIRPACPHRFVFICQQAHVRDHGLQARLAQWAPGCSLIALDGLTEGAACTVLEARQLIDTSAPLMIANSDQYVTVDIDRYLSTMDDHAADGLIMTMQAHDPKWSFAAVDGAGWVTRVAEKQVISSNATVGIYNFRKGSDFVRAADAMIARDLRVNAEFYVAPVYNIAIEQGARIRIHDIGPEGENMHGLGTPEDLERFLATAASRRLPAIA